MDSEDNLSTNSESASPAREEALNQNDNQKIKNVFNRLKDVLGLKQTSLKESLEEVIEEHDEFGEEFIDVEGKNILKNVLGFSEMDVEDVMIPRADIVAIDYEAGFEELKFILVEKAHTRIPVYKQNLDDISGFIHLKDIVGILCNDQQFNMQSIIRQVLFVPPSMKIINLLIKMQLSHVHMAIVVDEYGGTAGLITMEDLMEEIVGEIEDEHDVTDDIYFKEINKDTYEASARMDVEELEAKLGVKFIESEEDDFDTLGGLIFDMLGRVPAVGEVAIHKNGIEFEIAEADARRKKRVVIRTKAQQEDV